MITEQDMAIIARAFRALEGKVRGKYKAVLNFNGIESARITLYDREYNMAFCHDWQTGDSAASFVGALETRLNATDIINK